MTNQESKIFVDKVLIGYWPDWPVNIVQYGLWAKRLRKYDYSRSKVALDDWMCETLRVYKSPPINIILRWLSSKKAFVKINKGDFDLITVYKLFDINDPDWRISFASTKDQPVQDLEEQSSRADKCCSDLYCRKLAVLQIWNYKAPESDLKGDQARDKAFADILNGPDTRTKRWLERYLEKTLAKTGTVGDSLYI